MRYIKRLFYTTTVIFCFILNIEAQILEPNVITSKMQSHFENIKGFRTSFIEKNGDKTSGGEFIYKSPGKFKMIYSFPKSEVAYGEEFQTISFNGEYLWIYMPRSSIVSEQKIDTNESVGSFYTKKGIDRLTLDYNFNFYKNARQLRPVSSFDGSDLGISNYNAEHAKNDGRMSYHMELTPKKASTDKTGFVKIHLWVSDSGMILRAIGISTTQSIIEYFFYNVDYSEVYNDNEFNFIIPQGMLVLKDKLVN